MPCWPSSKNNCWLKPDLLLTWTVVHSYMYYQKTGPRVEYRRREDERVKNSATLAQTFAQMKSLTVDLAYSSPDNPTPSQHLKYTVNLAYAKSLFRIDCPNRECVEGDFDLSALVARTVASCQTTVSGQEVCRGWRSKATIDEVFCDHILHYTLTIGY